MKKAFKIVFLLVGLFFLSVIVAGWLWMPDPLFSTPYSVVLTDRNNDLLEARIAADGQWRFPEQDSIPRKYITALLAFEDKRFFYHPGLDPIAFFRAAWQNIFHGEIKSGGSTITMQTIRLATKNKRTIGNKLKEIFLAFHLELFHSKEEILSLYAAHAPFGGNVVGLETAAWRYYGRPSRQLSWGEICALAVLPNSPALVHPGRNREKLGKKRDRLINRLQQTGRISSETALLAKMEPLPDSPLPLPSLAPHLTTSIINNKFGFTPGGSVIQSTVDKSIQEKVRKILHRHHMKFRANGIMNGAALVMEVGSGKVLGYAGNILSEKGSIPNQDVDIITAARSPGSVLKPLLYMMMLQEGFILQETLIPDIPTQIAGYTPRNFDRDYSGAVSARLALARSLNIPAVRMLRDYRYDRFHYRLKKMGITTLHQPSDHYGLSLILGGGECSLFELAGVYGSLARYLNYSVRDGGELEKSFFHPVITHQEVSGYAPPDLDAAAVYAMFDAMVEVVRPGEESLWENFYSAQKIAWKTGTSFGFRDGWAIGVTPLYVVAVWIGNADGEGRPGLTGVNTAAPVLFDIFRSLPQGPFFEKPTDFFVEGRVCQESGHLALENCTSVKTMEITERGLQSATCPYHKRIFTDQKGEYRIHADCAGGETMVAENWFVLPPVIEKYYKTSHPEYSSLPPLSPDCITANQLLAGMEMVYPKTSKRIFIPRELNGNRGKAIFELAHRKQSALVHWHLDGVFIGSTKGSHKMPLSPGAGMHTLVLVDEEGESLEVNFEVLEKEKKG